MLCGDGIASGKFSLPERLRTKYIWGTLPNSALTALASRVTTLITSVPGISAGKIP
jgi:hypothetical protein